MERKIQILSAAFLWTTPLQIMDVDQEKGVLTTLLWLDLSWDDDYLRWVRVRASSVEYKYELSIQILGICWKQLNTLYGHLWGQQQPLFTAIYY